MDNNKAVSKEEIGKSLLLMGTTQPNVDFDLLGKAAWASLPKRQRDQEGVGTVQAFFEEVRPENPVEGMVYAQMLALHAHAMELMSDAHKTLSVDVREQYLKTANRLIKTFSASLEALNRFKCRGRQTIRVENVNVSDGGQAIVSGSLEYEKGGGGKI